MKGDVTGSVEAVIEAIQTFKSDDIMIKIIESGVGPITESDVELADSFEGAYDFRYFDLIKLHHIY